MKLLHRFAAFLTLITCGLFSLFITSLIHQHVVYPSQKYDLSFNASYEQEIELFNSTGIIPVVILTYQRCGSTFFGKLFNSDPDAFYSYEPLDAFYSSLYGTEAGWNSPSDIANFANGSHRPLPDVELFGVAKFLGNLLNCRADRLPTELLLHPFWSVSAAIANSSAANSYWQCLTRNRLTSSLRMAARFVQRHCGRMFRSKSSMEHEKCRRFLHYSEYRAGFPERTIVHSFDAYLTSSNRKRRELESNCLPLYRSMCDPRTLRVAKVVRASMLSMQPLMEWLPSLRVIHLVRDPRAVALSRRELDSSFRGQFADAGVTQKNLIVREATMYCRQVVDDVHWKSELERSFPGRFYSLTYEELVENPFQQAVDIYKFIGIERPPTSVIDSFVKLAERGTRNVTARTNAFLWRKNVTEEESNEIVRACSDMFNAYPEYRKIKPIIKSDSGVSSPLFGPNHGN